MIIIIITIGKSFFCTPLGDNKGFCNSDKMREEYNLPFCHKSMTVVCEVGPQRCVMCIHFFLTNSTILYINICIKIYFVYIKMIRLCDDDKRSYKYMYICIITVHNIT